MNKKILIDKQALIDELMKIPGVGSNSDALETIKRFPLYETKKPVVPQFVAEWFEENKDDLEFPIWELCVDSYGSDTEQGMLNWIQQSENKPIETLVRMTDGYEVEKEPLYEVVFLEDENDRYLLMELNEHCFEVASETENDGYRTQWFTERKIKSINKKFWQFAVPVEEVVEG